MCSPTWDSSPFNHIVYPHPYLWIIVLILLPMRISLEVMYPINHFHLIPLPVYIHMNSNFRFRQHFCIWTNVCKFCKYRCLLLSEKNIIQCMFSFSQAVLLLRMIDFILNARQIEIKKQNKTFCTGLSAILKMWDHYWSLGCKLVYQVGSINNYGS